MNAPFEAPLAVDQLMQAINWVRVRLHKVESNRERARIFWTGIIASRDLAASDVVHDKFMQLATDAGLDLNLGPHGFEALQHLIKWGLLARNPFR